MLTIPIGFGASLLRLINKRNVFGFMQPCQPQIQGIIRLCIILFLLVALTACQKVPDQPAPSVETGAPPGSPSKISGTTAREITVTPPLRDDRILVFDPPNHLYLLGLDGEAHAAFSFEKDIHAPALSPDGESLAYITEVSPMEYALLMMNVHTREVNRASGDRFGGFFSKMGWSPDGEKLAFDCAPGTASISQLCLINISTGKLSVLTDAAQWGATGPFDSVSFGSWSRDGATICFTHSISPPQGGYSRSTLYTIDLATRKTRKILEETGNITRIGDVSFSPDGHTIIFDGKAQTNFRIFQIDTDGSNLRPVTPEAYRFQITQPIISPDGNSFFAYADDQTNKNGNGVPTLFSMDGKLIKQLGAMPGYVVSWVQP